jgi:hypothetical protein
MPGSTKNRVPGMRYAVRTSVYRTLWSGSSRVGKVKDSDCELLDVTDSYGQLAVLSFAAYGFIELISRVGLTDGQMTKSTPFNDSFIKHCGANDVVLAPATEDIGN